MNSLEQRKHSKFSASGSERWHACPGSVALSEGQPDKTSPWAEEGTHAHQVLEYILKGSLYRKTLYKDSDRPFGAKTEVWQHGINAADFILKIAAQTKSEVLVESRVYLDFIHPEMFGTFDGAVLDHFGTLHVFDYKYGAGHAVSPTKNLQMIFYGLGLAYKYHWNFKRVRLWIIQPRIKGYDGPTFWDVSMGEIRTYVEVFERAVDRVQRYPKMYSEGSWCHWCKAKGVCPLKQEKRFSTAQELFKSNPITGGDKNGKQKGKTKWTTEQALEFIAKEKSDELKSEAQWRKESKAKKGRKEKSEKKESDDGTFY